MAKTKAELGFYLLEALYSAIDFVIGAFLRRFHRFRLAWKFILIFGALLIITVSALYYNLHQQEKRAALARLDSKADLALQQVMLTRSALVNQAARQGRHYQAAAHSRGFQELAPGGAEFADVEIAGIPLAAPAGDEKAAVESQAVRELKASGDRHLSFVYRAATGELRYRRIVPVPADQGCLECHPDRYQKLGEVVEGVAVSLPLAGTLAEIRQSELAATFKGLLTIIIALVVVQSLVRLMVLKPLEHLHQIATNIRDGKHGNRCELATGDELEDLGGAINAMTDEIIRGHYVIIKSLASALEHRDPYTRGHVDRVAAYALAVTREMGLDEEMQYKANMAAVLHDIGKIGIADAILKKPGPLDDQERAEMNTHSARGKDIIPAPSCLAFAQPAILHHHERFDGTGYPQGLKGKDIPILARVLAVVDTFDAMTTDRPYRKGLPVAVALAEIRKEAGKQFDPEVVAAFSQLFGQSDQSEAVLAVIMEGREKR